MAAPSPDDPNALGSDGLPQSAHTTTQTFGGKESTVAQVAAAALSSDQQGGSKESARHDMEQSG
ncbi:hypothetical protein HaLaN_20498, partial [Haematococcus lacustris]